MATSMVDAAMSVTDEQIDSLMTSAGQAGDQLQVAICAIATGRTDDDDYARIIGEQRRGLERLGIIPEHIDADVRARSECAKVIADVADVAGR